jgi:hypothetical protein
MDDVFLLNHLVRSRQYVGRNREAEVFSGFEVDDKIELRRLLDGEIGGLCPLQEFTDVGGGAPVVVV